MLHDSALPSAADKEGVAAVLAVSVTATLSQETTMTDNDPKTPQDLSDFAESLLRNVQEKFQTMSDQLTQRMDEIGSNIDELQKDIGDLMTQAGIENSDDVVH